MDGERWVKEDTHVQRMMACIACPYVAILIVHYTAHCKCIPALVHVPLAPKITLVKSWKRLDICTNVYT